MPPVFHIGQRLSFGKELCTVRYIGPVDGTKREWLGVEWDDTTRGKHNGQANGRRYFQCLSRESTAASFVRPNRVRDESRTFLDALQHKYAPESVDLAFAVGDKPMDRPIVISGKQVEEVGFDKVRKQLAELNELRVVILDGLCISSPTIRVSNDRSIGITCPKIVELDLSRNLLEDWCALVPIIGQLDSLQSLKVDGNRFQDLSLAPDEEIELRLVLYRIRELSLSSTLLPWDRVVRIVSFCANLEKIDLATNELCSLPRTPGIDPLPSSLTHINLEWNDLTALSDLAALQDLNNLTKLVLKNNKLSRTAAPGNNAVVRFSENLTEVDVSYNQINNWSFVNQLPISFPGLQSLRISNNPLFNNLKNEETQRPLSATDGYMLTLARLPHLRILNYSTITAKDRLNGESFYLGQIAGELRASPADQGPEILARHPRWGALCEEYGTPDIIRVGERKIDPHSLQARLITCDFSLAFELRDEEKRVQWTAEIPASFSIYAVLGLVGKKLNFPPKDLSLIWETGEREITRRGVDNDQDSDSSWNSKKDEDGSAQSPDEDVQMHEVALLAGTRSLGTWVDEINVRVRVEKVLSG